MAPIFTLGYNSLQILKQRNAKRRFESCCGNSATLNQEQTLKIGISKSNKEFKEKAKPDRADKLFLSLKRK